jgi:DNA-binding transcriptional LysR family regulator
MRITIEQLRGFVTLAATASFTQAAEALHLSQPALTARIRQLEEALDLKLFDRSTRSVKLSDEGRMLLPTFLQLVGDLEGAVLKARERSKRANGIIRMACLPSCAGYLLPSLIKEFRAQYPDASFVVNDAVNSNILRLVRDGDVDFGICSLEQEEVDIEWTELYADTMHVVFARGHKLEKAKRLSVQDLTQFPLVLTTRGTSVRDVVDRGFAALGLSATPACEVNYMSTAVALAKSGMGVAILPASAIELSLDGLGTRPIDDPAFARKIALIRRKSASNRAIVQQFIGLLLQRTAVAAPKR